MSMFKIDKYNVKIIFNMSNGIYVPVCESGTGKTWLCKTLKAYNSFGEDVAAYTYQDYKAGIHIENIVIPNRYKAIMIDRYDMFSENIDEELFNLCRSNAIVIIDSKFGLNSIDYEVCDIRLSMNNIEVTV